MKICIVAGARPNFMKIAPIVQAIKEYNQSSDLPVDYFIVHTGQHYDERMSELFFTDLGIPSPDINLEVGSASHAVQTAEIMKRFEKVCLERNPSHVLVVGDVNSTIACALVAAKLHIQIIHVEAGLRSFDRSMPEEINRILTDAISDYLFVTEKSAEENLLKEGIRSEKIFLVGNVMIDTLLKHKDKAKQSDILYRLGLVDSTPHESKNPKMHSLSKKLTGPGDDNCKIRPYAVLTLHRPSNVDYREKLKEIIEALMEISQELSVVFPAHPRTINTINRFHLEDKFKMVSEENEVKINKGKINYIEPLSYLDFIHLMSNAKLVLTDSGGIQEETTILGIPCVTIRNNTERPITVTHGSNRVVGTTKDGIINGSLEIIQGNYLNIPVPPLWDGNASKRIVDILCKAAALSRGKILRNASV